MIIENIHSPADVKALDYGQLDVLAAEIRQLIVESAIRVSGHLGSNLGVVELTLALHRVFDSPRDIMLWDTGHQAYVHKIVTGRSEDFETLRQAGGLSGYPSRAESEHDWIENSHASTILSYAHGLSTAQHSDLGEHRRVIAVIGDGSMTGGRGLEQPRPLGSRLHHRAERQRPVVRADDLTPRREPREDPQQPGVHAPPGAHRADAR
jgi:1-deoxy-D-xylulose-5-phosphate synthase